MCAHVYIAQAHSACVMRMRDSVKVNINAWVSRSVYIFLTRYLCNITIWSAISNRNGTKQKKRIECINYSNIFSLFLIHCVLRFYCFFYPLSGVDMSLSSSEAAASAFSPVLRSPSADVGKSEPWKKSHERNE